MCIYLFKSIVLLWSFTFLLAYLSRLCVAGAVLQTALLISYLSSSSFQKSLKFCCVQAV